jgi:hypothetical protein
VTRAPNQREINHGPVVLLRTRSVDRLLARLTGRYLKPTLGQKPGEDAEQCVIIVDHQQSPTGDRFMYGLIHPLNYSPVRRRRKRASAGELIALN